MAVIKGLVQWAIGEPVFDTRVVSSIGKTELRLGRALWLVLLHLPIAVYAINQEEWDRVVFSGPTGQLRMGVLLLLLSCMPTLVECMLMYRCASNGGVDAVLADDYARYRVISVYSHGLFDVCLYYLVWTVLLVPSFGPSYSRYGGYGSLTQEERVSRVVWAVILFGIDMVLVVGWGLVFVAITDNDRAMIRAQMESGKPAVGKALLDTCAAAGEDGSGSCRHYDGGRPVKEPPLFVLHATAGGHE
jgi:hypothetical protein